MAETGRALTGVAETSLITLYVRAVESQRPDSLLCDEKAVALVKRAPTDFAFIDSLRLDEGDRVTILLRNREFDRRARAFMAKHPQAVVVHIGCGLDARFDRVDDGRVEWYDLDLPEVIALRREFVGGEGPRHHLLSGSVFDEQWLDTVSSPDSHPTLFLVEGVLMYFDESEVSSLVSRLLQRFPGSELVFDTLSPLMVRLNNLRMRGAHVSARYHWGLTRGGDVEAWGPGIRLLDEWHPFDHDEPRLAAYRWVRRIPLIAKVIGIFHYRLGGEQRKQG
jgi:O-methyltransferase involved in polyketide biosynthesis